MLPLLATLSPNAAVLILTAGLALIALELNRPGSIFPGALGLLLSLLAAASIAQHHPRPEPVLQFIVSMALLLLQARRALLWIIPASATILLILSMETVLPPTAQPGISSWVALFCGLFLGAAQTTPLSRQMSRIDFGISGVGQLTGTVSGPIVPTGAANAGIVTSQYASNTVGAMGNIRYIAKPYIGVEFNYVWGRYTENYSPAPNGASLFQIQTTSNETSFGWIVTPPHLIFGMQPFASAGAGTNNFKPTAGGGNGAPHQYRATYYYNVGVQKEIFDSNFGIRASFRETFYLAPDFGQNYLTILKHTTTLQPTVGFYVRF